MLQQSNPIPYLRTPPGEVSYLHVTFIFNIYWAFSLLICKLVYFINLHNLWLCHLFKINREWVTSLYTIGQSGDKCKRCKMLQHLPLVWMPLVTTQNALDTALLIPIWAERNRVFSVGYLAIAASTCDDVSSFVTIFDLPYLLELATEPVFLNFLITFPRCHGLSAFCALNWRYTLHDELYNSQPKE